MAHTLRGRTAIAGLGITKQGKVFDNTHVGFASEAVRLALQDAGLQRSDLDGLLVNPGLSWGDFGMASFQLRQAMGLRNLRLSASMSSGGATAGTMIQYAAQAVATVCATRLPASSPMRR
jgi:acetyl-CoA acetyltransferase